MSRVRYTKRVPVVALLSVILGVGVLFAGCDQASQDEGKPATKVETPAPVKEGVAEESPEKPAEKIETGAPAEETVTENTASRVGLRPPILHLTMDDNVASPTVLDVSEGEHSQIFLDPGGNPNTGAHSVPGVVGTALAFDGIDDLIRMPEDQVSHIFAPGTDFSVAFWWRSDSDPFPNGYREILSNYSTGNGGIVLYQQGNAEGTYKRIYMNFYVAGNGGPVLSPFVDVPENTGRWHHYVFQREGSTLRAWRDGRLRGSYTDPAVSGNMGSGRELRINSDRIGAEGSFDDIRIYSSALTESEIRKLATQEPEEADLFSLAGQLRDLKANPASSASQIKRVEEALQKESDAQKDYRKRIGKNVEILAFRYSWVERDEYEMEFVFRTNARLRKDYYIFVQGKVDPAHVNFIPKKTAGSPRLQKWRFMPDPPTSTWTPGEVIVLRNWVKAAEVPYQMYLNLLHIQDGDYEFLVPRKVELGWYASL